MSPSCLPMQSPERAVFSTHGDTYHAEESVLRLPFLFTQKTCENSSTRTRRNFFLVVSLVRPLKPNLLRFFSRLSKESNETFTNASPHLLVCGIALCADSCVSMRLQGPSSLLSIFSKSKPRRGKALQTV